MFTGIVQFVLKFILNNHKLYLYYEDGFSYLLSLGCSVAVNGVCLTVVEINETFCVFDLSDETLQITNLSSQQTRFANVELPLKYGDYLGGHIMSGHVWETGTFYGIDANNIMTIGIKSINKVEKKGSISINGISLTVVSIVGNNITIALIPETIKNTNLKKLKYGDSVNIEFDNQILIKKKTDSDYMRLAIAEGEKGKFTSSPNPWVGCIIVSADDNIIGRGYHHAAGSPHAEIMAINSASTLSGSTLYCTLEPCCHFGRTPPCVDKIISCGISRVVIGTLDPDFRVAGKGIEKLISAGITVEVIQDLEVQREVRFSLRQYLHQRTENIPYVTLKIAVSLNNCYVSQNVWITHEESRKLGHELRATCGAIIVGAKTAEIDNPSLDVRYNIPVITQPIKIIIDGDSLISIHRPQLKINTIVFSKNKSKWKNVIGVDVRSFENLFEILTILNNMNIIHCLVEGGGILQNSFMQAGLVNGICVFRSPLIISGIPWNIDGSKSHLQLIESKIVRDGISNNNFERYIVSNGGMGVNENVQFSSVESAVSAFSRGEFVLVVDDTDRENEGDLICAAKLINESRMAQLINDTTGIICVPMESELANKLSLPLMIEKNKDSYGTAFTVSVDHVDVGTGVSAKDRTKTVNALGNSKSLSSYFNRPGHIFPLIAKSGGLLERRGHTEAGVELCKLANIFPPVAVIGELKNQSGSMKIRHECYNYAKLHRIPIISVELLIKYIMDKNINTLPLVDTDSDSEIEMEILANCKIQSAIGNDEWNLLCFGNSSAPIKVFVYGQVKNCDNVLFRIHSECFTGDVFKSKHCDCGEQLELSMRKITSSGFGVIVFPPGHEGRGIGFVNKVKAYDLQQQSNLNTFEANEALGFESDMRDYSGICEIIEFLKIRSIVLLTENPQKIKAVEKYVSQVVPVKTRVEVTNEKYLAVKKELFSEGYSKITPKILFVDSGRKLKIAIIHSSWHIQYINRINSVLSSCLANCDVTLIDVPGSNEIPFMAARVAKQYDGIICVGILIKGDTLHFESVSYAVATGIMQAQITTGVPMMNCIFSCLDFDQVEERITGNKCTLDYICKSLLKMIA